MRWALSEAWKSRGRDAAAPLAVALVMAALLDHDWDGFVFRTVVEQFLAGQSPYAVAAGQPFYAYLGVTDVGTQWWAYPPLMVLAMAFTSIPTLLANLPPWADRVLWKLPMVLSLLALAWVAGAWARRFGSDAGEVRKVERRFLWNPYLLLVAAAWGMTDVALMALYLGGLLAYGNGRPGRAGILVGLAFLVKPFPAFLFLPMVPYLVRRHGWAALRRFAIAAVGIVAAVCLPFFLADPGAFLQQVVGMHLARGVQGFTLWQLLPRDWASDATVKVLSPLLLVASLVGVGYLSSRLKGKGTSLLLTLLAGIAFLAWNRVVNEQYFVLIVAPILILDQLHILDRLGHFLTRWTPNLFAAVIVLGGFHFLTFFPPDVAMPLFGRPVDQVAESLRQTAPFFWWLLQQTLVLLVTLTLLALAWLALRILRSQSGTTPVRAGSLVPTALLGLALVTVGFLPILPTAAAPAATFEPAIAEPRVGAFHYLWWQNPAHDPDWQYGNWGGVTQDPAKGYYTSTRGVARDHVEQMVAAGVDHAIVSYHRGEGPRYATFQEEAARAGLWVAPLIELNQVYDQPQHHPVDETGLLLPFAAYRMDDGTRAAIVAFVLDLADGLRAPNALQLDGRPVLYFYDSYISSIGFAPEDQRALAESLVAEVGYDGLRAAWGEPAMNATVEAVLEHHPARFADFFGPDGGLWRSAHLAQHQTFWRSIRAELEAQLGPLYLVGGESFNERAGLIAGTAKSVAELEVFDAGFIYSPSFTWGTLPRDTSFTDAFARWEDRNRWLSAFAAGLGADDALGIAPSYDDRGIRAKGFEIPAFPEGMGAPSLYDRSWASLAAHPPRLALIATFNEFFEGSSIEPTTQLGDRWLRETETQSTAFRALPPADDTITILLHERASRTTEGLNDLDTPHDSGLELLAAASRSHPGSRIAAVDAQATRIADLAPRLVALEGGRAGYAVSAEALAAWQAWRDSGAASLLIGPELQSDLAAQLPPSCGAGLETLAPATLLPGDRLERRQTTLVLERDGVTHTVGRFCGQGFALSLFQPWGSSREADVQGAGPNPLAGIGRTVDAATEAACLAVAFGLLDPSEPTKCSA